MKTQQLKFNLIDKLISIKDAALLHKVEKLLSDTKVEKSETFYLTESQIKMLKESEDDIKKGRIISDKKLNEEEDKWFTTDSQILKIYNL